MSHALPKQQQGAAVVIAAVLLFTLILILGQSALRMMSTDITDSALNSDSTEALFLAESGLERAAQQLANGAACTALVMGTAQTFANGDFQITTASTIGNLCRITVTGRRLYGTQVRSSRTLQGDIQMAGSGGAFAIGDGGTILQWNGTSWNAMNSGTTASLRGIECVSDTSCMVVGLSGTALAWNGSTWTSTGGTNTAVNNSDVACLGALNDCHATATIGWFGIAEHWDGGPNWNLTSLALFDPYNAVSCATTNCYLVRGSGVILSWNGSGWSNDGSMGNAINDIDCPGNSNCWAVGASIGGGGNRNAVYYRDSSGWDPASTHFFSANPRRDLNDLSCININDCWAVGAAWGSKLVFARHTGSGWGRHTESFGSAEDLQGVDCHTDGTCWAVGDNGITVYYNGSSWSLVNSGVTTNLYDVVNLGSGSSGGSVGLVAWREIIA